MIEEILAIASSAEHRTLMLALLADGVERLGMADLAEPLRRLGQRAMARVQEPFAEQQPTQKPRAREA